MRNKIHDQKGTMLLESVIAILVLCMVVLTLIIMADILIRGRRAAAEDYDCAFEMNGLRDELAAHIENTKGADPVTLQQIADGVTSGHPKWQCILTGLNGRLAVFRLIYRGDIEDHGYEVKLYAP